MLSTSAQCASFADLAALLPSDPALAEILRPKRVEEFRADSLKRFGPDAGFALVTYSQSKEYDLLLKLAGTGRFPDKELTMELIIDAVKQGALSLEPKPDSGWYDYQWYALETLLLPERARESPKLVLTGAYKKRLKAAFKSMITKDRETRIKHLPVITMGMSMEEEQPVKVEIGPEFSAEPTATVYLRTARAYRFLLNALTAVLGEESLASLSSSPQATTTLDAELLEMSHLMYGIYDRVSTELGQTPVYLPGEIGTNDIAKARMVAANWFSGIAADPDLTHDARVSVPISNYPEGPVRYWATGGIRLERVRYEYISEPDVEGADPIFVPTFYYLPTDVSLEFERASAMPLTRDEFRQMCDTCDDEAALRKLLGAVPASVSKARYGIPVTVVLLLIAAVLVLLFRKLSRPVARRSVRIAFAVLGVALATWILILIFSPSNRIKFIVRNVASKNIGLGLICQMKFFHPYACDQETPAYMITSLIDLLSDDDPQVRYLSMSYLLTVSMESAKSPEMLAAIAEMEAPLRLAADDPIPEVANGALMLLGSYRNDQNLAFLRQKLKTHKSNDLICRGALIGLAEMGDSRALDDVLPFTEDPRRMVRRTAIYQLGRYKDPRAAQKIASLLASADQLSSRAALSAVGICDRLSMDETEASKALDPVLLEAAQNVAFSMRHRRNLADAIINMPSRVLAYQSLLLHPSAGKYETTDDCQTQAADHLGELGPDAARAIPALQKVLDDPGTSKKVRTQVQRALGRILVGEEPNK